MSSDLGHDMIYEVARGAKITVEETMRVQAELE